MKKLIDLIYPVFGITLFLSLSLTVITAIFLKRLNISGHSFNVPAFTASLLFISLFVVFTLKPSWVVETSKTIHGWKKFLVSILILLVAILTSYFGIYLPFNSKLLAEIPSQYLNQSEPFIIRAKSNKKYYIEIDSTYTNTGTKINMGVKNEEWSDNFTFTIGKKRSLNDKASFGTSIVDLPFNFPINGTYQLFIKFENNTSSAEKLRLFEMI
ncbi:MAG: hypothetical protein WCV55_01410 [Candidatus Paceibacterota bacterium]